MINPNGHYRKLNDQFIPLQNSNSSSKIVNGSSSVRITGNNMRGPIPDMKQHRGPFITQVNFKKLSFKWIILSIFLDKFHPGLKII